jgi:hypothetical protein
LFLKNKIIVKICPKNNIHNTTAMKSVTKNIIILIVLCCTALLYACADITENRGESTHNHELPSETDAMTEADTEKAESKKTPETTETLKNPPAHIPDPWNPDSIIFSFPASKPASEIYDDVKTGGWVVLHNSFVMAGEGLWYEFYNKVVNGEPATVYIAEYSTLYDPSKHSQESVDAHPNIFLTELVYDGATFKQMTRYSINDYLDNQGEYKYIIKSAGAVDSKTAIMRYEEAYHLVNDESMTYEEIQRAMAFGLYIPDAKCVYRVISDIKDEYTDRIPLE